MDWNAAIDINRDALKRVLASLVAMAGFGGALAFRPSLPRHLHRAVLRLLRPAEAATRRLVIVAARGLAVALAPPRPRKAEPGLPFVRNGIGTGIVLPSGAARPGPAARPAAAHASGLSLFDPTRPPFARRRPKPSGVPRIWAPGCGDPIAVPARKPPAPDDPVDATRLGLRLAALASVLDDLPKHATRFARWRARNASERNAGHRDAASARPRFRRRWPLRPGRPPGTLSGNGRRTAHAVHEILARTHGLAFFVLEHPDTS